MICVQICADITSHLIADEGWLSARTLAEGFKQTQSGPMIPKMGTSQVVDPNERVCGTRI